VNEAEETGQIRLAIAGAATLNGREALRSLGQWKEAIILLAIDQTDIGQKTRALAGGRAPDLIIEEKLGAALDREHCDILVDFSHAAAALSHGVSALKRGVVPVLNASFSGPELRELSAASRDSDLPALVVPHLSLAEVLSLFVARWTARWMVDLEVLDVHPDHRQQTASPMAKDLAEAIAVGWAERDLALSGGINSDPTRTWEDVRTHLLRMKGAHVRQEIRSGGSGESVNISYEPKDTTAIVEGLKVAIFRVRSLKGVTVGLEKLLFEK
jgi:4-hydroxy-tetrahydrodipicolinate reductase